MVLVCLAELVWTQATGIMIRPSEGPITSRFGPRRGRLHQGIDIGSPNGSPIKAADSGIVVFSAMMTTAGLSVIIDHQNGFSTRYYHCSRLQVSVGQTVTQGQIIALVGNTGRGTGPHLHFELRRGGPPRGRFEPRGSAINPEPLIGKKYGPARAPSCTQQELEEIRNDGKCGCEVRARCGEGRCCSLGGWCGNSTHHCTEGTWRW